MKLFIALTLTLPWACSAWALDFNRDVRSGVSSFMLDYYAYDPRDCKGLLGVVEVLSRPQNGRVSSQAARSEVGVGRYNTSGNCLGKSIIALQVRYRSQPGFRGTDSFQIKVTHPGRTPQIDNYSVTVR